MSRQQETNKKDQMNQPYEPQTEYERRAYSQTKQPMSEDEFYTQSREQASRRRPRVGPMNFEEFAHIGNHFINLVVDELDCNRNMAARITRAVLHGIRDRLPPNDAVEFAQGLPMVIKGIYFDQYDISATPVIIRNKMEFLKFIRDKNRLTAMVDFPTPRHVVHAIRGIFRVLERIMDPGQVRQVKNILNASIVNLIEHEEDDQ